MPVGGPACRDDRPEWPDRRRCRCRARWRPRDRQRSQRGQDDRRRVPPCRRRRDGRRGAEGGESTGGAGARRRVGLSGPTTPPSAASAWRCAGQLEDQRVVITAWQHRSFGRSGLELSLCLPRSRASPVVLAVSPGTPCAGAERPSPMLPETLVEHADLLHDALPVLLEDRSCSRRTCSSSAVRRANSRASLRARSSSSSPSVAARAFASSTSRSGRAAGPGQRLLCLDEKVLGRAARAPRRASSPPR